MNDRYKADFQQRLYPAYSRRATQVRILSEALEKIALGSLSGDATAIARKALRQANPFGWNERNRENSRANR